MFYDDDRVRAAAERCARLESWLQVERDPEKREQIERALVDAKDTFKAENERATKEKAEREASAKADAGKDKMFGDGNVTDFLKSLDKAAAEKKAAGMGQDAGDKDQAAKAEPKATDATADVEVARERQLLRELEPPKEITDLPEFKALYEDALAKYAAEAEAAMSAEMTADRSDAAKLDQANAPELQPGAEISGTVASIERENDVMVYIVRDEDGALTSLRDDANSPSFADLEKGDEVYASRDADGDYQVSYDNDNDHGM